PDLIQYGQVNRPVIGVELARPLRNIEGAVVLDVVEGSPAEAAGIQPVTSDRYGNVQLGDVIIAVNGESIASNSDLYLALEQYRAGDTVTVTVRRGKRQLEVPIELTSTAQ
ncbi:MAG: PDZ domain-containing protein, partial [Lewinella sp.]|nr:PDZ domain-containing protein [Lewinella sp.]